MKNKYFFKEDFPIMNDKKEEEKENKKKKEQEDNNSKYSEKFIY